MGISGRLGSRLARTSFLFANETDRRAASLPKNALESAMAEIGVDVSNYPMNGGKPATGEGDTATDQEQQEPLKYVVCVYDPTSRGRAATAIRTISMLAPRHVLHLVSFLGERDDAITLMRDAHLGWVVADGDTGAYGILDLMALGIPTVASEGGVAQRYIAHGISGALYPPDDSASTAAAVAGMLKSEESREAMGKAARTRVAREFPESQTIEGFDRAANIARTRSRRPG